MREKSLEKVKQDEDKKLTYNQLAQLIIGLKNSEEEHNAVVHDLEDLGEGLPAIRYVKNEDGTIEYSRGCDVNEPYIDNEINILTLALEHWSFNKGRLINSIIEVGVSSASVKGVPSIIFLLEEISVKREKLAELMEKSFELFSAIVRLNPDETQAGSNVGLLGKLEEAIKKMNVGEEEVKGRHDLVIDRVVAVSPGDATPEIREVLMLVTELIVRVKNDELASHSSGNGQQLFEWVNIVNEIDKERGLYKNLREIFNVVVDKDVDLSQESEQKTALKFIMEKADSESLDLLLRKPGFIKVMGGLDCIKDQALKGMIAKVLTEQVGGMDLDALIVTIDVVFNLGIKDDGLEASIAAALTEDKLKGMSLKDLAQTVSGVGSLSILDAALKTRIVEALTLVKLEGMSLKDLARTVSGVGSLSIINEDLDKALIGVLTKKKLTDMLPDALAETAWGLAKLDLQNLNERLAGAVTGDTLKAMSPNDFARIVWAVGKLDISRKNLIAVELTEDKLKGMCPNSLADTVYTMRLWHSVKSKNLRELNNRIARVLTEDKLKALSPNHLAYTLMGLIDSKDQDLKQRMDRVLTEDKLMEVSPSIFPRIFQRMQIFGTEYPDLEHRIAVVLRKGKLKEMSEHELAETVQAVGNFVDADLNDGIVTVLTEDKLREMHSNNLAQIVSGVGKLKIQDKSLKTIIARVLREGKLTEMSKDLLACTVWAVGNLNIVDAALNDAIVTLLTEDKLKEIRPHDLTQVLHGVGKLNIQDESLKTIIARVLREGKLTEMSNGDLAKTIFYVGNLNIVDTDLNAVIFTLLTEDKLREMYPHDLAQVVYGMSKLNIQDEGVKAMIARLLTKDKLTGMGLYYLVDTLSGVVNLNIADPDLNARIAIELTAALTKVKLTEMNSRALAITVCSVAQLNIQNDGLKASIAEALKQANLEEISTDLSARLTESLTKLGITIDRPKEERSKRTAEEAGLPSLDEPAKMAPQDAVAAESAEPEAKRARTESPATTGERHDAHDADAGKDAGGGTQAAGIEKAGDSVVDQQLFTLSLTIAADRDVSSDDAEVLEGQFSKSIKERLFIIEQAKEKRFNKEYTEDELAEIEKLNEQLQQYYELREHTKPACGVPTNRSNPEKAMVGNSVEPGVLLGVAAGLLTTLAGAFRYMAVGARAHLNEGAARGDEGTSSASEHKLLTLDQKDNVPQQSQKMQSLDDMDVKRPFMPPLDGKLVVGVMDVEQMAKVVVLLMAAANLKIVQDIATSLATNAAALVVEVLSPLLTAEQEAKSCNACSGTAYTQTGLTESQEAHVAPEIAGVTEIGVF